MTSKEQAQVAGTLQKVFMLCLKYPTAENLALAKEVMEAINLASIQTKEQAQIWKPRAYRTNTSALIATADR